MEAVIGTYFLILHSACREGSVLKSILTYRTLILLGLAPNPYTLHAVFIGLVQ